MSTGQRYLNISDPSLLVIPSRVLKQEANTGSRCEVEHVLFLCQCLILGRQIYGHFSSIKTSREFDLCRISNLVHRIRRGLERIGSLNSATVVPVKEQESLVDNHPVVFPRADGGVGGHFLGLDSKRSSPLNMLRRQLTQCLWEHVKREMSRRPQETEDVQKKNSI